MCWHWPEHTQQHASPSLTPAIPYWPHETSVNKHALAHRHVRCVHRSTPPRRNSRKGSTEYNVRLRTDENEMLVKFVCGTHRCRAERRGAGAGWGRWRPPWGWPATRPQRRSPRRRRPRRQAPLRAPASPPSTSSPWDSAAWSRGDGAVAAAAAAGGGDGEGTRHLAAANAAGGGWHSTLAPHGSVGVGWGGGRARILQVTEDRADTENTPPRTNPAKLNQTNPWAAFGLPQTLASPFIFPCG